MRKCEEKGPNLSNPSNPTTWLKQILCLFLSSKNCPQAPCGNTQLSTAAFVVLNDLKISLNSAQTFDLVALLNTTFRETSGDFSLSATYMALRPNTKSILDGDSSTSDTKQNE